MDYLLILKISKTHLLTRIKQPLIAALGVTFGIGTFVILVSFMTGLNGLLDGLTLNRTPHVHIYNEIKVSDNQAIDLIAGKDAFNFVHSVKPKSGQLKIHNALPLIEELKEMREVRGVTPQVDAQVFYMAGSVAMTGMASGIIVENELSLFHFSDYIIDGNPEDLMHVNNSIIVGAEIAKSLLLKVGDRIQVTSATGGLFNMKIIGIYQSGLADIDKVQSYVSLKTAQNMLGENASFITDVNVKLNDMTMAPAIAEIISRQYDVSAKDIQTANAQFETGTTIRNIITYAVSITLLIVAGFGIYNILNMLIYEKMNDIAILKATGFTGNDVQAIFISQALIIGVLGGLLGLIVGYGMSAFIDTIPFETEALPTVKTFPVNYNPSYYLIGISFALVSTFLAGYLPARKAKSVDPVEIIRGQ